MDKTKILAFFQKYWSHTIAGIAVVLLFLEWGCPHPPVAPTIIPGNAQIKVVETVRTDTIKVPTLIYVTRKATVLPRSYQLVTHNRSPVDVLDTCLVSDTARLCIHIEHEDSTFHNMTMQAFIPQVHHEVIHTVENRVEIPVVPAGYVDGAEYSPKNDKWYFALGGGGLVLLLELLAKVVFHL